MSHRLKTSFYSLYYKLLANYFSNQFVFIAILLLEFILFLCYPLWLNRNIENSNFFGSLNNTFLSYQVNGNTYIFYFCLCVSVILMYAIILSILLIKGCFVNENAVKTQDSLKWLFRSFGFMLILLQYLFIQPILEIFFSMLSGSISSYTSYSANLTISIVSGILCVVSILIIGVSIIFLHVEQIGSPIPWTMSSMIIDYIKLFKKILISFTLGCNYQGSSEIYIIVGLLILSLAELFFFLKAPKMDKKWIYIGTTFCEVPCSVIFIAYFINSLVSSEFVDYITIIIFLGPISVFAAVMIQNKKHYWLLSMPLVTFNSSSSVEEYIRNLLGMIDSQEKLTEYPILMGVVNQHTITCKNNDCFCHALVPKANKEGQAEGNSREKATMIQTTIEMPSDSKLAFGIYNISSTFLQECMDRIGKYPKLFILRAYIQYILLHNKFQALYDMQQAEELNPNIYEEYLIFSLE